MGSTRLEVLNNPLSVGLAKLAVRTLVGEGVGHGFSRGEVLNRGGTARGGSGRNSHFDLVSSCETDAGEVVGVVGVPFIPSIIGDTVA